MKPKKIHKFCVACRRPKMLFETEAEAQAFIRFNSGDILKVSRKAPVRSYYCQLCGGYHVTSNPSKDDAIHMDERDNKMVEAIDVLLKAKKEGKPTLTSIVEKMEQANILMTKGSLLDAERLLNECQSGLQSIRLFRSNHSNTDGLVRREYQLKQYMEKLEKLKELTVASEEEQAAFLKYKEPMDEYKDIAQTFISMRAVAKLKTLQKEIHNAIGNRDFSLVNGLLGKCQSLIDTIRGSGSRETRRHWNKKMQYAQHRAKVEREKMKEEKKIAKRRETKKITPNENVGDFDSIMDELLGKPGSPEREAFRREALEYCSQMEENENETLDVTDN